MQSIQGSASRGIYGVSVLRMKMNNQRLEGDAAQKLIESAGQVAKSSNQAAQALGLGRRVDVTG